jgi:hypothetical protein
MDIVTPLVFIALAGVAKFLVTVIDSDHKSDEISVKRRELDIKEYAEHIRAAGITVKPLVSSVPGSVQALIAKRDQILPLPINDSSIAIAQTSPVLASMASALTGVSQVSASPAVSAVSSTPVVADPVDASTCVVESVVHPDRSTVVWLSADAHVVIGFYADFNKYFLTMEVRGVSHELTVLPGSLDEDEVLDYANLVGKSVLPHMRLGTFSKDQVFDFQSKVA